MKKSDAELDLRDFLKNNGLECLSSSCRDEIEDHVKVHKYFLDKVRNTESDWDEALDSWYKQVFLPLKLASDSEEIHKAFPDMKSGDLYIEVSHHWLFMKQYNPDTTPEMAAHDYAVRYGKGLERWLKRVDDSAIS